MKNSINPIPNNRNLDIMEKTKTQKTIQYARNGLFILLLIALPIIWIWKDYVHEKSINVLTQNATTALTNDRTTALKQISKAYVWAIRKEMMTGNLQQVGLYANDMVKEQNVKTIIVCNEKGIIVSATDKKLEGQMYSSIGKLSYLQQNFTIVEAPNDILLNVVSPIMGFNSKLGTLIISYKNSPLNL